MGVVIVALLGLLASSMSRPGGSAGTGGRAALPPQGFAALEGGGVVELVPLHLVTPHAERNACSVNSTQGCPPGMVCKRVTYPNGDTYYVCASSGGTGGAGPNTNTITRPPKPPGIEPGRDASGSCCPACADALKRVQ